MRMCLLRTSVPAMFSSFVNFMGHPFSDAEMKPISDLLWRQMDWVQPESYVADGGDCLLFATRNSQLYGAVRNTLNAELSKRSGPEIKSSRAVTPWVVEETRCYRRQPQMALPQLRRRSGSDPRFRVVDNSETDPLPTLPAPRARGGRLRRGARACRDEGGGGSLQRAAGAGRR